MKVFLLFDENENENENVREKVFVELRIFSIIKLLLYPKVWTFS